MINLRNWTLFLALPLFLSLGGCPQDGGCFDQYDPNDTCIQACDIGIIGMDEAERSWTATICSAGEEDWFKFTAEEGAEACIPASSQSFVLQIGLVPPAADCPDLQLALYNESCELLESSEQTGCQEEEISFFWDGQCGFDDSNVFIVRVYGADDTQVSQQEYTLSIDIMEM